MATTAYSRAPSSGTAALSHKQRVIPMAGNLTVPANIFSAGNVFHVYNDNAYPNMLIQGSGLTLRKSGTTVTGDLNVSARGFVTVWFNSPTEAIVSGTGMV